MDAQGAKVDPEQDGLARDAVPVPEPFLDQLGPLSLPRHVRVHIAQQDPDVVFFDAADGISAISPSDPDAVRAAKGQLRSAMNGELRRRQLRHANGDAPRP